MPRTERVVLSRYPHHVVQRGHNRQAVFAEARDYERYLSTLEEFKAEYGVKVYAYCLMTNHVHLLRCPSERDGIGKLMKRLAGRQTRHHNHLEGRSGTLWEGRYKSIPVDSESYLLVCCRYIELNPVRARMVESPQAYSWSSCRYRFGEAQRELLDLDPCYLALGNEEEERRRRYGGFLQEAIPNAEMAADTRCHTTWSIDRHGALHGRSSGHRRPSY